MFDGCGGVGEGGYDNTLRLRKHLDGVCGCGLEGATAATVRPSLGYRVYGSTVPEGGTVVVNPDPLLHATVPRRLSAAQEPLCQLDYHVITWT
jgi:hypothetical protein